MVLLVAVAFFALLLFSGTLSAKGNSQNAFDRVKEVQERHTGRIMELEGVEGTAIGFNQNDQLAVKVFTAGQGVAGIPQELDGVPVQVVVTGKFYALSKPDAPPGQAQKEDRIDPTAWFERPVPIGVSTGHPDITAGTIGCRVTDGFDVYALSNNHVYADEGDADIGDNVLQPGPADGGEEGTEPYIDGDEIGTLYDFVPIDFGGTNYIDAAIALTTTDDVNNATPSDGYGMPSSTIVPDSLNLEVQKYGRTTGLTKGAITEVNFIGNVGYSSGTALFADQIVIMATKGQFSRGGDSGSLIVTQNGNNPVGLLFAGGGRRTIACPIGPVLDAFFGVYIDGQ